MLGSSMKFFIFRLLQHIIYGYFQLPSQSILLYKNLENLLSSKNRYTVMADALKAEGNKAFAEKNFDEAM